MTDLAGFTEWLEPGFEWLEQNWADDQPWEEVKPQFLEQFQVSEAELDSEPAYRSVAILIEHIERMDDAERRTTLLNAPARNNEVAEAYADYAAEYTAGAETAFAGQDQWGQQQPAAGQDQWGQQQPAAGQDQWGQQQPAAGQDQWGQQSAAPESWNQPAPWDQPAAGQDAAAQPAASEQSAAQPAAAEQAGEPASADGGVQYVEGHGYMRFDAETRQWVPAEPPADAEPTPSGQSAGPAASSDAAGAQDAGAQGAAAEPDAAAAAPPAPEDAAGHATEVIIIPALTAALQDVPELAQLSAEDRNALIAEVVADRVAAGAAS
jgi:hypothetical protein